MPFAAIANGCSVFVMVQENMLLALSRHLAHGDKPSYGKERRVHFCRHHTRRPARSFGRSKDIQK
jgi:hypothetical protein